MQHCFHVVFYIIGTQYLHILHPGKMSPSELVSNGYISNHNEMRRPRPKFKVSFYLCFCCFWISVTQINFENIKRKIQRIISDSCFQLKSWFNVDARAPSIPLLNYPPDKFSFEISDTESLCLYITPKNYETMSIEPYTLPFSYLIISLLSDMIRIISVTIPRLSILNRFLFQTVMSRYLHDLHKRLKCILLITNLLINGVVTSKVVLITNINSIPKKK